MMKTGLNLSILVFLSSIVANQSSADVLSSTQGGSWAALSGTSSENERYCAVKFEKEARIWRIDYTQKYKGNVFGRLYDPELQFPVERPVNAFIQIDNNDPIKVIMIRLGNQSSSTTTMKFTEIVFDRLLSAMSNGQQMRIIFELKDVHELKFALQQFATVSRAYKECIDRLASDRTSVPPIGPVPAPPRPTVDSGNGIPVLNLPAGRSPGAHSGPDSGTHRHDNSAGAPPLSGVGNLTETTWSMAIDERNIRIDSARRDRPITNFGDAQRYRTGRRLTDAEIARVLLSNAFEAINIRNGLSDFVWFHDDGVLYIFDVNAGDFTIANGKLCSRFYGLGIIGCSTFWRTGGGLLVEEQDDGSAFLLRLISDPDLVTIRTEALRAVERANSMSRTPGSSMPGVGSIK